MVQFKEDILWTPNQAITVDLMNFMCFNDVFVNNHFMEAKVANVAGDGSIRTDMRWLVNHASFFARKVSVNPSWELDNDGWRYYSGRYDFPGNNFWDAKYQPMVVATPYGHRALPQAIILKDIRTEYFTYTWYIFEDVKPPTGPFYMEILAVGIKPVEDNALDSDVDPSP